MGNQNTDSDTLLDGDDDTLSSLDEKDLENLTGKKVASLCGMGLFVLREKKIKKFLFFGST